MGHFNFLALAHWRKIVQIDIYYDFQCFFNEHEYKYAVDVMRNSIHVTDALVMFPSLFFSLPLLELEIKDKTDTIKGPTI
jgi:hypothetical protein